MNSGNATTPLEPMAPAYCVCDAPTCACPDAERALRHLATMAEPPGLSRSQRDWCLHEIERVEGYDRADFETVPTADLARGVLEAWTDYCRDKGMI